MIDLGLGDEIDIRVVKMRKKQIKNNSMEKLGRWRDPSTGVNPFAHKLPSISRRIILLILGIFRIPLGISLYLTYMATGFEFVRKLLFYVAGITRIDFKECIYQNGTIRPYSQGKLSASPSHGPEDIIICNSVVGWLDKLFLKTFFPDGLYRFPELCSSNNKGILLFEPELVTFEQKNARVRLVSLRYDPVPLKSWWFYPNCHLTARTLSPEAIWESSIELDDPKFPLRAQELIAFLIHSRPLQLGYEDYIEFERHSVKAN